VCSAVTQLTGRSRRPCVTIIGLSTAHSVLVVIVVVVVVIRVIVVDHTVLAAGWSTSAFRLQHNAGFIQILAKSGKSCNLR